MGIERIIGAIEADAAAQIAEVLAVSNARVASIAEESRARAEAEREKYAGARHEEAERKRAGIVNRARLEADRRLAAVREELFQQAVDRLEDLLSDLVSGPRYEAIFEALYEEARAIVTDSDATVLVRPEDLERTKALLAERGDAASVEAARSCIGGLDLETDDGRAVRNTFDSRLARSERSLRMLAVETIPAFARSEAVR